MADKHGKQKKPINWKNVRGCIMLLASAGILVYGIVCLISIFTYEVTPIEERYQGFSFVYDDADVLSDETETFIYREASALETATSAQVVVATTPDTAGLSLENYSLQVANGLGIGNKDLDNGVFVLFVVTDTPRVRLEIGQGLEGTIPDGKAGRILDAYAVEAKNEGQWDKATRDTFVATAAEVYAEYGMTVPSTLTLTNGELPSQTALNQAYSAYETYMSQPEPWIVIDDNFIGCMWVIAFFVLFIGGICSFDIKDGSSSGSTSSWRSSRDDDSYSSSSWSSSSSGGSFGGGSFGGGGASR